MPEALAHIKQANRNQKAIDHLLTAEDELPEWVTCVAFYKALHLVEAAFACDSQAPKQHTCEHTTRNSILRSNNRYKTICKHYLSLHRASLIARYLHDHGKRHRSFPDHMDLEKVKSEILGHRLKQIENACKRKMTEKVKAALA